eukprot:2722917-Rhodomonas_salina.1
MAEQMRRCAVSVGHDADGATFVAKIREEDEEERERDAEGLARYMSVPGIASGVCRRVGQTWPMTMEVRKKSSVRRSCRIQR